LISVVRSIATKRRATTWPRRCSQRHSRFRRPRRRHHDRTRIDDAGAEGKRVDPAAGARAGREAPLSLVSAGFGPMLGMSIVSGRWLNEMETPGSVVINESLARRDFAGSDPIGARIKMPWLGPERMATIVGVARDLKYADVDKDTLPELFFHHADAPCSRSCS
jgi:hypothetical protein